MPEQKHIPSQKHPSEAAAKAAAAGQPRKMLVELRASGFLGAAAMTLRRRHPALSHDQVDSCIAEGIEETYKRCQAGKPVEEFTAYIWKVAHNKCSAHANVAMREVPLHGTATSHTSNDVIANPEADSHDHLREGIRLARSLIPGLGQENVVTVMTILLDAVESGVFYISAADISTATGLSENTVRQCLSRGRRRLRARAHEHGYFIDSSIDDTARSAEGDQE